MEEAHNRGFASGVPARDPPRRSCPDLPSGPAGPPRPPVARYPAGFSSCSSAAGSELEPSVHTPPEGFSLPGCVQRTCHAVLSQSFDIPSWSAKLRPRWNARPPPVPPSSPRSEDPLRRAPRRCAPSRGRRPGTRGDAGGFRGAAYGARGNLRRAEWQRAVAGRERSGGEAPREPGSPVHRALAGSAQTRESFRIPIAR
jgi:hypothetical protein